MSSWASARLSTAIIVVLGIRIFGNTAALRRRLFERDGDEITVSENRLELPAAETSAAGPTARHSKPTRALTTPCDVVVTNHQPTIRAPRSTAAADNKIDRRNTAE